MTTLPRRSLALGLVAAMVGFLGTTAAPARGVDPGSRPRTAAPASAADPDFPPQDALYHTYTEMVSEIHATEAARPDLVDVFSIGTSARGRDLWAAKVSDNVATDESEPEVLFVANIHGDEHLTLEQALYLFNALVGDYGADAQVTKLVNSREVWIVFMLNPDGATYDLGGDPYRDWRKNRQLNPTSTKIGTDPNRNFEYHWGCCGGSSGNPAAETYRGWAPFSAPETRALADFVDSRVVGGQQQIRTHIGLHQNGELILWPYGYTRRDVPGDMTAADWQTFVRLARAMAATNGYTAGQSGDWNVNDGDEHDWLYGRHRIFSFTMELYPRAGGASGHYPPDEKIAAQTKRNRAALLYLIDLAGCPYRASGTQNANCGLLYDDLELARGWTRDPFGEDTATGGGWARGNPDATSAHGPKQLGSAYSGSNAYVTGLPAGAKAGSFDLDGRTSVASRQIVLPADPAAYGGLTFKWYLAHSASSSSADELRVYVVDVGTGTRTKVFERLGTAADVDAAWTTATVSLSPFAGKTIRLLFVAGDNGPGNLVEAGLDDIRIQRPG